METWYDWLWMSYSVPGLNCVKRVGEYMIDIWDESISVFYKETWPDMLFDVNTLGNSNAQVFRKPNVFGILTPPVVYYAILCCVVIIKLCYIDYHTTFNLWIQSKCLFFFPHCWVGTIKPWLTGTQLTDSQITGFFSAFLI